MMKSVQQDLIGVACNISKEIAEKPYSTVKSFINARMSIALVRASTRCIRGSRITCENHSRHFIPCVSSTDGMYETQEFLKRLAKLLAEEWEMLSPSVRGFQDPCEPYFKSILLGRRSWTSER